MEGGGMSRINRDTEVLTSFLRVADSGAEDKGETSGGTGNTSGQATGGGGTGGGGGGGSSSLHQQHTVWQLAKELKLKSGKTRRNRSRYEEVYTDKDRAAAVNMGSRDIKQSLKMKRKADKSKELSLPEETEPGALLALAGYEMTAKRTNIALDFINKALDLNPEDKQALVARSKCYLLLGEAKKALEDAEAALTIDHAFIKALFQKAEALYHLGDFEHSLMYFHRGLRLRPDMEGFRLGVQKAQEAIENIIGSRTTGMLASPEQLSLMLNGIRTVDEVYKTVVLDLGKYTKDSQTKIPPRPKKLKKGSAKSKTTQAASAADIGITKAERHLLGDLYTDKVYLEELLANRMDVISLNQEFANNDVAQQAKEGIDFLTTRQDFWRQQKPKTGSPMKIKRKKEIVKGRKK